MSALTIIRTDQMAFGVCGSKGLLVHTFCPCLTWASATGTEDGCKNVGKAELVHIKTLHPLPLLLLDKSDFWSLTGGIAESVNSRQSSLKELWWRSASLNFLIIIIVLTSYDAMLSKDPFTVLHYTANSWHALCFLIFMPNNFQYWVFLCRMCRKALKTKLFDVL